MGTINEVVVSEINSLCLLVYIFLTNRIVLKFVNRQIRMFLSYHDSSIVLTKSKYVLFLMQD